MRIRTSVGSLDALVGGGLPYGACLVFRDPPGKDTDAFAVPILGMFLFDTLCQGPLWGGHRLVPSFRVLAERHAARAGDVRL